MLVCEFRFVLMIHLMIDRHVHVYPVSWSKTFICYFSSEVLVLFSIVFVFFFFRVSYILTLWPNCCKWLLFSFHAQPRFWSCLFWRFVQEIGSGRIAVYSVYFSNFIVWMFVLLLIFVFSFRFSISCVHVNVCVRVEYRIDPIKWRLHLSYEHFTYSKLFLVLENGCNFALYTVYCNECS